nr:EIIBC-MurNAc [Klebsiella pneumoniae]
MMPANLDMILTSAVTLLIMGAVTFTVIMPIGGWLFTGMSWLFLHLNGNPFGSAVLAGLFLLAVMFGVHQGLSRSILRWWTPRALTRCSRSWRWPGPGRWGGAGAVLAGEARFAAANPD